MRTCRVLSTLLVLPLLAQDFTDISIEKFTAGYVFTEGPVWSRDGYLLFTDAPSNKIWKVVPGEKPQVWREGTNGASGLAFDSRGNLYVCETRGRQVIRIDKKGAIETLAEKWEGKRLNAPNDIVVRRDGHAWFTDPAFGTQTKTRELDFYGIYHIPPKGPIELVAKPKGRPNGIALSSNGRILYVTNSDERNIYAYDVDGRGAATNERVLVSGITGVPDGLRVDEKGNLFVAAGKLAIYTPAGKLIREIELSETPHNCTFGGEDFQTLFITASSVIYRIRLDTKGSVQH